MSNQIATRNQLNGVFDTEAEMTPGAFAWDEDGNRYIKCLAAATLEANELCKKSSAALARGVYYTTVVKTAAIADSDIAIGATTSVVNSGKFFWLKQGPRFLCQAGSTGNITVGATLYASATPGEVDDAAGTSNRVVGYACSATTGAGTITVHSYLGGS